MASKISSMASDIASEMSSTMSSKMASTVGAGPMVQIDTMATALKESFLEISMWNRLLVLMWMVVAIPLHILNTYVISRFLNRERNKPLKKLDENIWVSGGSAYHLFKLFPTYMMVVRGKDAGIMVFNPIELQDYTLSQVQELGKVKAIFIANHFHDNWIRDWMDRFPDAKIYTSKMMKPHLERSVPIHGVIEEDADLCDNYGILKLHDISVFLRTGVLDYMLVFETSTHKKLLVLPHIASTETLSYKFATGWFLGYTGSPYPLLNTLIYTKDLQGLLQYTTHTMASLKPQILFALHGKSIDTQRDIEKFIHSMRKMTK